MRAVVFDEPGGPEVLHVAELPDVAARDGELLIEVAAAGVNRADLLQRRGFYPPPPGASPILGLEVAGTVAALGPGVTGWQPGERVMALIEGGGYADLAAAPCAQSVRVPDSIDIISAAGIPEVFITAHDALFTRAGLQAGETVLIHGGAGGVGTAAIQLAARQECRVIATAGTEARLERCTELGAGFAINHREEDFVERVLEITAGAGADVVLDVMGAAYLERNLAALAVDGRMVVIATQGGNSAELNLALLMRKRASVITTMLRARPHAQKARIVAAFDAHALPDLARGALLAVIDRVVPLADAATAHRLLEAGEITGKVLLRTGDM